MNEPSYEPSYSCDELALLSELGEVINVRIEEDRGLSNNTLNSGQDGDFLKFAELLANLLIADLCMLLSYEGIHKLR